MAFRTAAVVVGVNRSPGQVPLRNAERDAQDLAAFLRGPFGPVAPNDVLLLVGNAATRSGVARAFGESARRRPNLLFVMFSGHGNADSVCLADGSLNHQNFADWIKHVGAARGAVIIDACQAEAFASYVTTEISGLPDDDWQTLLARMLPGTRLLLASRSDEFSSDGAGRNGAFTGALLEAFRRLPGTFVPGGRRYIMAESAFQYAAAIVRQSSGGGQTPVMLGRAADFPIARPQAGTRLAARAPRRKHIGNAGPVFTQPANRGVGLGGTLLAVLVAGGAAYAWSRRPRWDANVGRYRGPGGQFW